jgi:hypothetical protein
MPDGFASFGGLTETGVVPAKTHAIERLSLSYRIPRLSLSVKGSQAVRAGFPIASSPCAPIWLKQRAQRRLTEIAD